jgi:hypothetical protein
LRNWPPDSEKGVCCSGSARVIHFGVILALLL